MEVEWQICSICGPEQHVAEFLCSRCLEFYDSPLVGGKCPECEDKKCCLCDEVTQHMARHMCDKHNGIMPEGLVLSPMEQLYWVDSIFSDRLDKIKDPNKIKWIK